MTHNGQQMLSLFFAVLLITTASFSSVVSAEGTRSFPDQAQTTPVPQEKLSSQAARQDAYRALRRIDHPNNKGQNLLTALNRTFTVYLDENRISMAIFSVDRRIAVRTNSRVPEVTTQLLDSDAQLAHTSVTDAERVFTELRKQGVEFDENAVRDSLSQAERSLRQGDRLREKGSVGAFTHYRRAWSTAQRALDRMDEARKPTVTITHRVDPAHKGSLTYTITGTVRDVRMHDLKNMTLLVNGEQRELSFYRNTTPGGTSYFHTNVTLTTQRNEIIVGTTDPGIVYADNELDWRETQNRGNPAEEKRTRKERANGRGNSDVGRNGISTESQSGEDILLLDADRLPDHYERETVETEPLNPDSDSANTTVNESDNGAIDGAEDFDDDGVVNVLEFRHRLNPFNEDTDGDRLTDLFELTYDDLDPRAVDTNVDETTDDLEDFDGEGFENIREQRWDTNPHVGDTDTDNITDEYEVDTVQTIPTNPDSDSNRTLVNESTDGRLDGAEDFDTDTLTTALEFVLKTNPFDADTDDDRLTDSFEHAYGTISPITADTNQDGMRDDREDPDNETLSNVLEQHYGTHPVRADTDVDNLSDAYEVNVTFTDPVVADSNSTRTDTNEAGDGIVDGAEDFDEDALRTALEAIAETDPFDPDTDNDRLLDGFERSYETMEPLLVDTDGDGISDSREDPDEETLWNVLEQKYGTNPLIGDTDTDELTDAYEVNMTDTNPLVSDSDSTRTVPDEAGNELLDGREDFDDDALRAALEYKAETNPFDPDTDGDHLRDGFEFEYAQLDPLRTDSDDNGIADAREDFDDDSLTNQLEQRYGTHPLDRDTDNDGLIDSFEVNATRTDPTRIDSNSTATNATEAANGVSDAEEDLDADGLVNRREQVLGTDPIRNDTDHDGLLDGYEVEVTGTKPLDPDSDSTRTDSNEAMNGSPDGREDFDADGLATAFEQFSDLDPYSADTDGDELTDAFETAFEDLDPTVTDTDGDDTADAAEDLDEDGLTNLDEQRRETMPLTADTDQDGLTDGSEVDLGTNPVAADSDGDTLIDGEEQDLGTDPLTIDTDADELTDSVETEYGVLNATIADSDDDGIADGADDVDADGLTNREETDGETELTIPDMDGDRLLDGQERDLGTDPLVSDTDTDGLTDFAELDVGADPLVPDTDGDGILDGEETYTAKTTDEESGVSLSVTGAGNVASNTTIVSKPAYHNGTDASAGPTIYIERGSKLKNEHSIQSAKITVPVRRGTNANPKDLAVYVWNGSTEQPWHPVKSQVDTESGTVSANVEAGTYVTVLNRTAWEDAISVDRKQAYNFGKESLNCTGACDGSTDAIAIGEGASASSLEGGTLTVADDTDSFSDGLSAPTKSSSSGNESEETISIQCKGKVDGTCDYDWDDDGTPNRYDQCPLDADDGCLEEDSDSDGIPDDEDSCDFSSGPEWNNGCPEPEDSDRDNDNVDDDSDACPDTWGSKSNGCPDRDQDDDGTRDENDPCPVDRYDRCDDPPEDPDSDGDGVDDDEDNCPTTENAGQANADGDADGNVCDSDDDGDGIDDGSDNCRLVANAAQVNRDGDDQGAACDPDEPDYDEASWQVDVPAGTGNVYFEVELLVNKDPDEQANLTVIGAGGETRTTLQDTDAWRQRTLDLGQFAGDTITVRLSATGDGTIRARGARVYQDSDADTLSDYRERQRWTIPYGYGDSFTLDPNGRDSDGDGLADSEEVSLGPAPSNPASPLRVRYATSNPGEVDTDGDALDDAVERRTGANAFLADTDYDRLNDGEEVNQVGTDPRDRDTDGDRLWDGEEGEMTVRTDEGLRTTYSDPVRADTDSDGLLDGEEVSIDWTSASMTSDPSEIDTDNDRLDDFDEAVSLGTDPMDSNMDDDRFIDGRDPNIRTEDNPPTVQAFSSENYRNYIQLTIYDRATVEIEANAYYGSTDNSFWSTELTTVKRLGDDQFRIEFEPHGILGERPDKYWVNVTDTHGTTRAMLFKTTSSGGAKLVKSGVASFGFAAFPTPDDFLGGGIIIGAIGLGSIANGLYQSEYVASSGEVIQKRPPSGLARRFNPSAPELPTEVVLPVGAYVAQKGVERGYGWEYIAETTSLTQGEIGRVLENPDRVVTNDDITYVIDKLANGKSVVLTIIGGTLMAASHQPVYNEKCGETVDINDGDNPEHSLRDEKPVNDITTLKEILSNPTRIVDAGSQRYYILKIGPNKVMMVVANVVEEGVWYVLKTQLTDDGRLFKTVNDAIEETPKKNREVINPDNDC